MKVISVKKENILIVVYVLIIAAGLFRVYGYESIPVFSMPLSKKVVIIDPGHGGKDPGKVAGKVMEKDINLEIAKKLQKYLELADCTVIMTRVDDMSKSTGKKADMYKRKTTANGSQADIFVSIHQNSFSDASAKGAMVFYFNESDNSKRLAECIQKQIKSFVDYRNKMEAKSNGNYFVLRQTTMPAVLVECGFLTNPTEKNRLMNPDYQDRMAWAIYMGIIDYFNSGV